MGNYGGVNGWQRNLAAGQLSGLGTDALGWMRDQYGNFTKGQQAVTPFYQSRMTNGLPFYRNLTDYNSGAVAQAFAPQRAALLRQTGGYSNMPSGFQTAALTNLGAQQGRAFDQSLVQAMYANEMAKQQGAAGLQGQQQIAGNMAMGMGGLGANAANSILNAPPKPSPWGMLGGMAMQGIKTAGDVAAAG